MSTGINIIGQEKLVSGTNIKTINGNSLLGSGDLVISGAGLPTDITSPENNDLLYYNSSTSLWSNLNNDERARNKYVIVQNEFFGTSAGQISPFTSSAIGSATFQSFLYSGSSGLGVVRIISGLSATPSGLFIGLQSTSNGAVFPKHLQQMNMIFRVPNSIFPDSIIRAGFINTSGGVSTDSTDGYYIELTGNSFYGKTAKSNVRSQTPTSYTVSSGTYYHCRLTYFEYTIGLPYVEFQLYSLAGTLLWTSSLNTNVTVNSTTLGICAFQNAPNTSVELTALDYIGFYLPTTQRGAL